MHKLLTQGFTSFLRRRRAQRHFARRPLLDAVAAHALRATAPEHLAADMLLAARAEPAAAIARFQSHENGLTAAEIGGAHV